MMKINDYFFFFVFIFYKYKNEIYFNYYKNIKYFIIIIIKHNYFILQYKIK